ncbi:hypothetical protein BDN72DRAFT_739188, partial [Pluteus cervinus]
TFDKLTETNYHEWAVFMEALLIKKQLWDLVNGTTARPTTNNTHMRNWDPIWNSLAQLHGTCGLSSRLALRRRLITMRKSNSQSMTSWIADVRRAAHALSRVGYSVSNEDLILVLMIGLPPSYHSLIVTLDAVDPTLLTIDFVVTRLLSEESRQ